MNNSNPRVFVPSEAIASNEVKRMLENVVDFSLVSIICYLGIVGNIITIAVFLKQGYKETTNIALTAIAIWDLIKCICGAMYRLHGPIGAFSPILQITYRAIASTAFAFPAYLSSYISNALAAYVSIERCLCVSLPFTVKYLLTPKVVTSAMILLSTVTTGLFSINFILHEIKWVFHPALNATVAQKALKQYFIDNRAAYVFYSTLSVIWPLLSLAIQTVCTCIIAYHLRKSAKFRSGNFSSHSQPDAKSGKGMSGRDRQVTKMLVVIILIYIVNSVPKVAVSAGKAMVPEFYMFRHYHNFFASCLFFINLSDFLNASINPVVYYFMSSQYKTTILEMFCKRKERKGVEQN